MSSAKDVVLQGWLVKSPPPGVMKGWKRRFFRLRKAVRHCLLTRAPCIDSSPVSSSFFLSLFVSVSLCLCASLCYVCFCVVYVCSRCVCVMGWVEGGECV